ncbi:MAG: agmatinase, partial [Candidatus Heimdallarchaeota archaeon]|nr:agmatinase [Candidatus Heimdallarchaeota archaeon]
MSMIPSFPKNTPSFFADAETEYDHAKMVLFGVPYEESVSFRKGTKQGPLSIRQASWNFESFNIKTGVDFRDILLHDYGNIDIRENVDSEQMIPLVSSLAQRLMNDGKIPVVIGGEHTASVGIVQSLPKDCMVVVLDAHADFRDEYLKNRYSHACTLRRISEIVGNDNVLLIGVRSAGKQEFEDLVDQGITYYDSYKIHDEGVTDIISDVIEKIHDKSVYLSIDIDSIDPGFAPGTGTPEP